MNKLEAVKELQNYDHCFLSPEGVKELGEPFGIYRTITAQDNRSDFKGLNLGEGYKEGDTAEGLPAHTLAQLICEREGVNYPYMHGIGSQLRVCCEALIEYLSK